MVMLAAIATMMTEMRECKSRAKTQRCSGRRYASLASARLQRAVGIVGSNKHGPTESTQPPPPRAAVMCRNRCLLFVIHRGRWPSCFSAQSAIGAAARTNRRFCTTATGARDFVRHTGAHNHRNNNIDAFSAHDHHVLRQGWSALEQESAQIRHHRRRALALPILRRGRVLHTAISPPASRGLPAILHYPSQWHAHCLRCRDESEVSPLDPAG